MSMIRSEDAYAAATPQWADHVSSATVGKRKKPMPRLESCVQNTSSMLNVPDLTSSSSWCWKLKTTAPHRLALT